MSFRVTDMHLPHLGLEFPQQVSHCGLDASARVRQCDGSYAEMGALVRLWRRTRRLKPQPMHADGGAQAQLEVL